MKINLLKIVRAFLTVFILAMAPCAAEDVSEITILAEIFSDTGDDYEKITAESGGYLSVECDVETYETLRGTYYVCDVAVADSYSSFKKNRYINVGGIYEVFAKNKRVKNGSFSVNPDNYDDKESYRVNYAIFPTMHFVYVKTDGSWKHTLTTADYRTYEFNDWYFFAEDDHDSLTRRNTYTSDLSDESLRHSAAIDAYDLDDVITDLPKECVIEVKGGEHDYGTVSVKLNLPANASALYNRVKGPVPVAVWVFSGLAFVCAVGFLPLVIDKYRRRKYHGGVYAEFRYNPDDGSGADDGGSDSGEE